MTRRFIAWLVGLFTLGSAYKVKVEADVPDRAEPRTVHVIGENRSYWLAMMRCPCGCGHDIQLPLSGLDGPRWSISGTPKAPTLTPSVHRMSGCRSHFVLRRGNVIWCR
jgi:hypothetical protein